MTKSAWLCPITDRVTQPGTEEVKRTRKNAGLSQAGAARLVSPATKAPHRVWQHFEAEGDDHRDISLAAWELFLLLTDQHPALQLTHRRGSVCLLTGN